MYEIYCKLRDSKGYKDATIAKETGLTKSTFSDWKNGRSTPKQEKLQKIADFFGVSIEYLMTGKEDSVKKMPRLTAREKRLLAYAKELEDLGVGIDELRGLIDAVKNMQKKK